ncbi:MAG: nucleoside-diphosphate kinase [Spirochaetales bacterium]|nr:nucleoside-diphosphate kinase [Spirochaetales bacterium]
MERTLVILKPDAVQRALVGAILSRLEHRGLKIKGIKMLRLSRELAERHYAEHRGKDFFEPLVQFITSGPSVLAVLEADSVIEVTRCMCGPTNPCAASPGTIRGDYGVHTRMNLIHASDSPESAEREITLFFRPEELVDYQQAAARWV